MIQILSANIVDGVANVQVSCSESTVVTARKRVRFIGAGPECGVLSGDLVLPPTTISGIWLNSPSPPGNLNSCQHWMDNNVPQVDGVLTIEANTFPGSHPSSYMPPTDYEFLTATQITPLTFHYGQRYFTYNNQYIDNYDAVVRGADPAKAPLISKGSWHDGNWDPPEYDIDTDPLHSGFLLDQFDHADKSLLVDESGCLIIAACVGIAHSYTPPSYFDWMDPDVTGCDIGPMLEGTKIVQQYTWEDNGIIGYPRGLAWYTVEKPEAGMVGNIMGRIRKITCWDEGHWWWGIQVMAIKPQRFDVTGTGTTRSTTISGLTVGDEFVIESDSGETVAMKVTAGNTLSAVGPVAILGQGVSGGIGPASAALAQSRTVAISGVGSVGSRGSLTIGLKRTLTGYGATGNIGTITASGQKVASISLSGQGSTANFTGIGTSAQNVGYTTGSTSLSSQGCASNVPSLNSSGVQIATSSITGQGTSAESGVISISTFILNAFYLYSTSGDQLLLYDSDNNPIYIMQ